MRALLVGRRFHPRNFKTINIPKAHASTKAVTVRDDLDVGTLYQQGRWKEALLILQVKDRSVERWTYIYLLQGCIERKALSEGKRIHAHMNQRGEFMADTFLSNILLNMYIKCGSVVDARRVFDQMAERERDVCSWTAMIAAYSRHGPAREALVLFHQMKGQGARPNQFTFSSVLPACANLGYLEQGIEIHYEITRSGLQSDVVVANALLDMYAKCGSLEKAREVFDKMRQRTVVSWNAMIAGYAQNGLVDEAHELFKQMPCRDLVSWNTMMAGFAQNGLVYEALGIFKEMRQPDVVSWNTMITGFSQIGLVDEAFKLLKSMCRPNIVSWNAMLAGFAQNGFIDEAYMLFQKMPHKNVLSWTTMMAGFVQNGHGEEALRLFHQMELAGVKPDSMAFASILPACANFGALEQGMEIHEKIIRTGFQSHVVVVNALVDMYAKCGNLWKARELFDNMHERNVVTWSTIVAGYAINGFGREALKLFEEMLHCGIGPNDVTLVGVLSACSHAGLVDEGYGYFNRMSNHYQITPSIEHYRCMVDLLGRAGHLDEALDFIEKMPIEPDAFVWSCLLGACSIHNNIEVAECAAHHIFKLDPSNSAPYVLLSNIYAAAGRWADMRKVRQIMKDRGIKKAPGCSWIEVNKKVHAFLVGDWLHANVEDLSKVCEPVLGVKRGKVCSKYDICIGY